MISLDGYWTLRKAAAKVRRSDRAVLVVTGHDRAAWLQGLLTNDVLALDTGQSCYSAYLTPRGRMITDMQVVALGDRVLLDVPASLAASLRERLDGLIFAEDAQVTDATDDMVVWGVYGPEVEAGLQGNVEAGLQTRLGSQPGLETRLGSQASLKTRLYSDTTNSVPGLTLYLDARESLPGILTDLPQVGLDTLDVLRIEAGTPRFLVDMTEDTIPLEAGIEDRAISFTKGCYVGQELIVRVTRRGGGRVAKRLVRWKDSSHAVPVNATIVAGDRDIGRVTSAAFSPAQEAHIGLGYVHRDFAEPGTEIVILADGVRVAATTGGNRAATSEPRIANHD